MLKSMRKNLKSLAPTLWFVIIAFIISIFAVWGGAGRLGEGRGNNTLATVGKEKISVDFYYQTLRQRLEAMQREYKELDSRFIQQLNIPQQVLNQIIQQTLLDQLSKEMGIEATDDEIRNRIMNYPVFQKEGKFVGFAEYKRILDWNHIPLGEFEKSLSQEIILDKAIQVITAGVTVTGEEVWENYKNNSDSAKLEYAILALDKVELDHEPSDTELEEYFIQNKAGYQIPEEREADYFFIKTEDLKNEVELNDAELEDYYETNTARFKEPEKIRVSRIYLPFEGQDKEAVLSQAREIIEKIHQGEDFGELAKKYSRDEKSSESGDWGQYEWRSLSEQEQDEIDRLNQGEASNVLELQDGAAILKVTEKVPETTQPFEAVRERIVDILKDEKARELADTEINQLQKAAKREQSLDVAAQKLGYKVKNTGLLKKNDPIEGIDPSGSISMAMFNLQEREISSPIYTYTGVGLAQLIKIEEPRSALFDEVKEQVLKDFEATKKKDIAAERIQRIKQELSRKQSLEALAEEHDLEYKTVEEHKRGQYLGVIGENKQIDELSFMLPIGEVSDPVEIESGYALIRVLDRKEVTREEFEKEKKTETENLLETKKTRFFASFLSNMRQEKEVKIRYDLFLKTNSDILSHFGGEQE